MPRSPLLGALVVLASASAAHAGPHDFSPTFRQKAVQLCTSDAMRLCMAYLSDEGQTARCMEQSRDKLTPSCRAVVDEGVKIFRR